MCQNNERVLALFLLAINMKIDATNDTFSTLRDTTVRTAL